MKHPNSTGWWWAIGSSTNVALVTERPGSMFMDEGEVKRSPRLHVSMLWNSGGLSTGFVEEFTGLKWTKMTEPSSSRK